MRNLIRFVAFISIFVAQVQVAHAIALEAKEVLFVNSISRFFDTKPEGTSLKQLEEALRSENPCIKGIGAAILYKHFGKPFRRVFFSAFTLKPDIGNYQIEKRKFVKIENVDKILEGFAPALSRLKDERARRIFLFFHFRQIDLWLIGQSGEKLSLAVFYRISALDSLFGPAVDVVKLANQADQLKK
ncbi:MAG: hypothetical protein Kow0029_03610 [Candidatus Rifleibacteriota bacterium]